MSGKPTTDKPEKSRRRGLGLWMLAAAPLLYVLSLGPYDVLCLKGIVPTPDPSGHFHLVRDTFDVIYAPLDWATRVSVPIRQARRWYAHLFVG